MSTETATLYIIVRRDCQDVMGVYGTQADADEDVRIRESGGSLGRYRWEKWNVPAATLAPLRDAYETMDAACRWAAGETGGVKTAQDADRHTAGYDALLAGTVRAGIAAGILRASVS